MKAAEVVPKVSETKVGKLNMSDTPLQKNFKKKKTGQPLAHARIAAGKKKTTYSVANAVVGYGKSTMRKIPNLTKGAASTFSKSEFHWPSRSELRNWISGTPILAATLGLSAGAIVGMILPRSAGKRGAPKKTIRRK